MMKVKKTFQHSGPRIIGMNLSLFVLGFISILFCSCQQNSDDTSSTDNIENWAEYFFEERLASISADTVSDCFYITTEDGPLYLYRHDEGIKKYLTDFERIYCVVRDRSNHSLWVGTRNNGLHHCILNDKENRLDTLQSFSIPVFDHKYSVYSITVHGDSIFVGTSHGLYKLYSNQEKPCQMTEVWLSEKGKKHGNPKQDSMLEPNPAVVGYMLWSKDTLFFTTPGKIYKYFSGQALVCQQGSADNMHADPILFEKQNGIIMGVIGDSIYILNGSSDKLPSINQGTCDMFWANNNYYQVTVDSLYVYTNGTCYGRRLPSASRPECRHLIADDKKHSTAVIVTFHHLLRTPTPHHYSFPLTPTDRVMVSASCAEGDSTAFFLVNNIVYKLNNNDTILRKTSWSIPPSHHASFMTSINKKIYYVNNQKEIYSLEPNELVFKFEKSVTAICGYNKQLYVGIRDILYVVDTDNNDTTRVNLITEKGNIIKFPFVTAFSQAHDSLYVATLNDGVFVGPDKNSVFHRDTRLLDPVKSQPYRFIRDIVVGKFTYILTNNMLWIVEEDPINLTAEGYSRLLSIEDGSGVAAISDYGITKFRESNKGGWKGTTYFQDWMFRPEASLTVGNRLLVSRNKGIMSMTPKTDIRDRSFEEPTWLSVEKRRQIDWLPIILALCIAMICGILWLYLRHRHQTNAKKTSLNNTVTRLQKENELLKLLTDKNDLSEELNTQANNALNSKQPEEMNKVCEDINQYREKIDKANECYKKWDYQLKRIVKFIDYIKIEGKLKEYIKKLEELCRTENKIELSSETDKFFEFLKNQGYRDLISHLQCKEKYKEKTSNLLNSITDATPKPEALLSLLKELEKEYESFQSLYDIDGWEMVKRLLELFELYARSQQVFCFIDLRNLLLEFINNGEKNSSDYYNKSKTASDGIYKPWATLGVDSQLYEIMKENEKKDNTELKAGEVYETKWGLIVAIYASGLYTSENNTAINKLLSQKDNEKEAKEHKSQKSTVKSLLKIKKSKLEDFISKSQNLNNIAKCFLIEYPEKSK
jgi:hypothetical protein